MILAGIDEAGYGPLLGPLVIGCCAFDVQVEPEEELPCVWGRLRKVVSKTRSKSGKKLHVNDSKQVYTPGIGLKELERSVLAMVAAGGEWPADLDALLRLVAPESVASLAEHPWYAPRDAEPFPLEQESASVRVQANALRQEMDRCGARCLHLAARVLPERQLNRQFEQTRNKSSVAFTAVAGHLDRLMRTHADRGLTVYCDRQGGREHYGHLLRLMWEDWALEIVREQDGHAEYRLTQADRSVTIVFCEKAEARCLPVAMASMLSKYLREALMRRFNGYWLERVPGLLPTAGYYNDGLRFLTDIAAKRAELAIPDADLVRAR